MPDKILGVDYYGQPTSDPAQIEKAARRNARDVMKEMDSRDYFGQPTTDPKALAEVDRRRARDAMDDLKTKNNSKGGKVKSSASKRADGIATKGFTKGRYM